MELSPILVGFLGPLGWGWVGGGGMGGSGVGWDGVIIIQWASKHLAKSFIIVPMIFIICGILPYKMFCQSQQRL